ncbi:MAG TPA: hypothetical protein VHF22_02105, partial [Planctomycetota bacterium]|nr:hypothetical protein [Planctomycetota bacterium]
MKPTISKGTAPALDAGMTSPIHRRPPESGSPTAAPARTGAGAARARTWRLVALGLAVTLFAGSLVGAVAIVGLHSSWLEPLPQAFIQGHAFAQLFGFVLPVAIGMALRLLPPPAWRGTEIAESAVLVLVGAGVAMRLGAYVAAGCDAASIATPLAWAGTALLDIGIAVFIVVAASGLMRRRGLDLPTPDGVSVAALVFLIVATALDAWGSVDSARRGMLSRHVYPAFLEGFATSLSIGMLARMGPA